MCPQLASGLEEHFPYIVSFHPHAQHGRREESQVCPFSGQAAVSVGGTQLSAPGP